MTSEAKAPTATDELVEMVRKRADVPRVRSSEVARILQAAREITREHPGRSFFTEG